MGTGARWFTVGWSSAFLFALTACGGSAKSGGSSGDGAQTASSGGSANSSVTGSTGGDGGSSGGASSATPTGNGSSSTGNGNSSGGTASDTTSSGGTGGSGGSDDTSVGGAAGGGGSSASGGSAGTSGGDCTVAEDCELFQDCCSCRAVAVGSQQASCRAACDQSACDAQGVSDDDVACLAGRCVINRSCDDRSVECDVATPTCEAGSAPEVLDGCYTGNCREVSQCALVSSCDVCEAADLNCVTFSDLGGPVYQCVRTREGCDPKDCECMGVCTSPFICSEDGDTLSCACLLC